MQLTSKQIVQTAIHHFLLTHVRPARRQVPDKQTLPRIKIRPSQLLLLDPLQRVPYQLTRIDPDSLQVSVEVPSVG